MGKTEPYTEAQNCLEWQIAIQANQLASPFGFDGEAASDFSFATSSCAASTYSFTTPTQYAPNSTTQPPSRPICAANRTYIIQADYSCSGIAKGQGVAIEALVGLNRLDLGCKMGATCQCHNLPPASLYRSIKLAPATLVNPSQQPRTPQSANFSRGIQSSARAAVTSSDGAAGSYAPAHPSGPSTCLTAGPPQPKHLPPTTLRGDPTGPAGNGTPSRPTTPTCASISLAFGITLADFYFLNHQVDTARYKNLWLDYTYCVKAAGNIQTYPDYPLVVPPTSFTRPPPANKTTFPAFDPPPLNPHAPGTVDGCER